MKLGRRTALKAGAGGPGDGAVVVRARAGLKLPLSTVWPDGHFQTVNCRRFADDVRKVTGGAVDIDVKSGGRLGFTAPESLRAVRDGLVPIADYLDTQQVGDEPFMGIEGVPFLVASREELQILHKHIRPEFEKIAPPTRARRISGRPVAWRRS